MDENLNIRNYADGQQLKREIRLMHAWANTMHSCNG